jgi:hypothetical protein
MLIPFPATLAPRADSLGISRMKTKLDNKLEIGYSRTNN